jgi:hypothetical protein
VKEGRATRLYPSSAVSSGTPPLRSPQGTGYR